MTRSASSRNELVKRSSFKVVWFRLSIRQGELLRPSVTLK
jgi:hypothetical protein